jgi:hypothetical protein
MALQPFVRPSHLQFRNLFYTQYDSLDEWSARRKAATYTQDNTNRINAHRHPYLEWDSNWRSQRSSERRPCLLFIWFVYWHCDHSLPIVPGVIVKIVEKQMECKLAGETEVLGENMPQRHFCPSQNPTWQDPGLNPGRRGGKPATNRLSYGAAWRSCLRPRGHCDRRSVELMDYISLTFVMFVLHTHGWAVEK